MGVGSGVGSVHKVLGEYAARRETERSGGTSVVTVSVVTAVGGDVRASQRAAAFSRGRRFSQYVSQ